MVLALLLVPTIAGAMSFLVRSDVLRRLILMGAAVTHSALTYAAWLQFDTLTDYKPWLSLDRIGLLFLSIVSALFLMAALYAVGYLMRESHTAHKDFTENIYFVNEPEAVFIGCLLLFLASMTLVTMSFSFGLLWVAVEATTLASAPLIYFHRHHRSLEATWKYLLICSVGIALALLGNFLLVVASSNGGESIPLNLLDLSQHAKDLHVPWLKAAFLMFLVGYGTKMGLAPLHTWLPDAHSESPSVVSALLSGALLNCAFLGILRAQQICIAAGQTAFSQEVLLLFGLLSMAFAAVFILGQADFKRMLAYSSVEHMGILALGVGLGGAGVFGSMFHAINHSLTKACLFLVAGNILALYRTKSVGSVRGISRALPISGVLWLAGFLSIIGSPPFGTFLSEFTILKAALDQGHMLIAITYLGLLALIFVGMAAIVLEMAQGQPTHGLTEHAKRETALEVVPPALLVGCALLLGLYIPTPVHDVLHTIARSLGGN